MFWGEAGCKAIFISRHLIHFMFSGGFNAAMKRKNQRQASPNMTCPVLFRCFDGVWGSLFDRLIDNPKWVWEQFLGSGHLWRFLVLLKVDVLYVFLTVVFCNSLLTKIVSLTWVFTCLFAYQWLNRTCLYPKHPKAAVKILVRQCKTEWFMTRGGWPWIGTMPRKSIWTQGLTIFSITHKSAKHHQTSWTIYPAYII